MILTLKWWKENAARFPILARIARDVLAVPVSTVASELAFSTSGRILNDFRTSLTPFMVQALVCTQDWLRGFITINIEEDMEELFILEKELIEEFGSTNSSKSKASNSKSVCKPSGAGPSCPPPSST